MDIQTQSSSVIDLFRAQLSSVWNLHYADLSVESPYEIDCETQTITIHNFGLHINKAMESHYFAPQIELITIESLRMAYHAQNIDDMLNGLRIEDIIILARVIEADIQTTKIMAAWLARMQNNPILWRHVLCGDNADMATAFVRGLEAYLSSGMDQNQAMKNAMAMGFNQWFSCATRQQKCDHDTLNMIDDRMNEFCIGQMTLSDNDISMVTSLLGDDISYLNTAHCHDILINPYYGQIRDEINQVHFNHIYRDMDKTYIGDLAFHDDDLAHRFVTIH